MIKHITSREFGIELCKQLGIDSTRASRIVIDCRVNELVKVYVEMNAPETLLDIKLPDPQDLEVKII